MNSGIAGEEAEQHDPQHAHVVLVRGERQDNRTRKRQIEYQTLHDFVITLAENVDMFEYVDTDDNEQQRTGLKNHVLLLSHKHPPQHRRRSGA